MNVKTVLHRLLDLIEDRHGVSLDTDTVREHINSLPDPKPAETTEKTA